MLVGVMFVVIERKFVVTKTNMPHNRRNERTKKLKFLLSRDICVSLLICGPSRDGRKRHGPSVGAGGMHSTPDVSFAC